MGGHVVGSKYKDIEADTLALQPFVQSHQECFLRWCFGEYRGLWGGGGGKTKKWHVVVANCSNAVQLSLKFSNKKDRTVGVFFTASIPFWKQKLAIPTFPFY